MCLVAKDRARATFPALAASPLNEQQRVRRVARPAGLGNQKIEAQRRKVIRKGGHIHVTRLVQHLRIAVTVVAGLCLDRSGIAVDFLQGKGPRLAAGDAHGSDVIPRAGTKRAVQIACARRCLLWSRRLIAAESPISATAIARRVRRQEITPELPMSSTIGSSEGFLVLAQDLNIHAAGIARSSGAAAFGFGYPYDLSMSETSTTAHEKGLQRHPSTDPENGYQPTRDIETISVCAASERTPFWVRSLSRWRCCPKERVRLCGALDPFLELTCATGHRNVRLL
jgi:hypothetical protein